MDEPSAVDLAPRFERSWVRPMLVGLDKGRSTAMNRFVVENGRQAAVYAVCVQFWVLVSFGLAVLAVVTLVLGAHHSSIRIVSDFLWALFALGFLMAVLRYSAVLRSRKQHRARSQPR